MTETVLKAVLDEAQGKTVEGGYVEVAEGRRISLHASHAGVGMVVSKIERISIENGVIRARNERGELFVLGLDDVFAASIEGTKSASGSPRKAGFLG